MAKKPQKNNPCECCGEPCRRRFIQGHDAKLLSRLIKRVDQLADEEAAAELIARRWRSEVWAAERLAKAREKLRRPCSLPNQYRHVIEALAVPYVATSAMPAAVAGPGVPRLVR